MSGEITPEPWLVTFTKAGQEMCTVRKSGACAVVTKTCPDAGPEALVEVGLYLNAPHAAAELEKCVPRLAAAHQMQAALEQLMAMLAPWENASPNPEMRRAIAAGRRALLKSVAGAA